MGGGNISEEKFTGKCSLGGQAHVKIWDGLKMQSAGAMQDCMKEYAQQLMGNVSGSTLYYKMRLLGGVVGGK